jgi:hypothetical protein
MGYDDDFGSEGDIGHGGALAATVILCSFLALGVHSCLDKSFGEDKLPARKTQQGKFELHFRDPNYARVHSRKGYGRILRYDEVLRAGVFKAGECDFVSEGKDRWIDYRNRPKLPKGNRKTNKYYRNYSK